MSSLPGDPAIQQMQDAANSSPRVKQLRRMQSQANQGAAVQTRSAADAPLQCLRLSGQEPSLPDLRSELEPFFTNQMDTLDIILPIFMDVQTKNYPSAQAMAFELRTVVGIYRDLTRTDSVANLIAGQTRGQGDYQAFAGQGWFRKLFTTVGFEHEFADMHNSFLGGVSHMEIAESQEAMPVTDIPFFVETDAGNALELVSAPFLLPTVGGSSMPDPDVIGDVDTVMRQGLQQLTPNIPPPNAQQQLFGNVPPPPTVTLDNLLQGLNGLTGLTFDYTNLNINPEHLSHRADPTAIAPHLQDPGAGADPQLALEQADVQAIDVRRSHKSRNEAHEVSAQVNFATDLETASSLMGPSAVGGAAVYRDLETHLRAGLNLGGANAAVQLFSTYLVKNLCSLFSVYSQEYLQGQQGGFHDRLAQEGRHVNGHGGGPAAAGPDAAGISEFRRHAGLSSYVKDSTQVWIKDHLVSQAEGILKNGPDRQAGAALALEARNFAANWNAPVSVTGITHHSSLGAHWTHFKGLLRSTAARVWNHLNNHTGADAHPQVDLYGHDPLLAGGRQDTMLNPAHVQQPDLSDERLHVAEIRRGDPADQIRTALGR